MKKIRHRSLELMAEKIKKDPTIGENTVQDLNGILTQIFMGYTL